LSAGHGSLRPAREEFSVYLANISPHTRPYYVIRETYRSGGRLLSRDLCDLGPHPWRHICYPGGNAFYVDERIEATVRCNGGRPGIHDLEDLLRDFVKPDIRHAVEHFHRRGQKAKERGDASRKPAHVFDRRRMYYLRCGKMDQSRLGRVPERLFRPLIGKSRDEIEQLFIGMESQLQAHERKAYLFTVFDLQRHFSEHFARTIPQWIDVCRIDACFESELCALHADDTFWSGMPPGARLHPYLARYAIMFFDHDFGRPNVLEQMLNDYVNQHRQFRWPPSKSTVTLREASEVFETSSEALGRMSRVEITRCYRRLAQRLHPDKGGDQNRFVRLTEAYHSLLRRQHQKAKP
jgi:hypothetical protein